MKLKQQIENKTGKTLKGGQEIVILIKSNLVVKGVQIWADFNRRVFYIPLKMSWKQLKT